MMGGGMQARDYMPPADIKENGTVDEFSIPDQRLQQAPEVERILEDNSREHTNGFLESPITSIQDLSPAQMEESIEEPQKHTYASVVCALCSNNLLINFVNRELICNFSHQS